MNTIGHCDMECKMGRGTEATFDDVTVRSARARSLPGMSLSNKNLVFFTLCANQNLAMVSEYLKLSDCKYSIVTRQVTIRLYRNIG